MVVGIGFDIDGAGGAVAIDEARPIPDQQAVRVLANEIQPGTWARGPTTCGG